MTQDDRVQDAIKLWVRQEYGPPIERLARLEEKHEGALRALNLQAAEYERRLEALNHAHQRHEQFAGQFVSEQIFNAYQKQVSNKFEVINAFISELRGMASGKVSTRHLMFEVVTLIVAAIAVAAAIYFAGS
jgi:hypothetical protein